MNRYMHRGLCAVAALALGSAAGAYAAESDKNTEASRAATEQKLEAAQKRLDEAAREVAELSMSLSDHVIPHVRAFRAGGPPHAVLGVNVGRGEGKDIDDGVTIASVSPGGGADKAGLKANDVIVELNGKSLRREGDQSPRAKLLAGMREVKPGDKVSVRYRRADKVNTATVVAEAPHDRLFTRAFAFRGEPGMPLPHMSVLRSFEGAFGSAELVPMTPKLGQYFGTEQGLLVVRAPDDARLKLEEGDVILDIDGRTPTSVGHALRILSSYQAGEKLKLNVLRAKKKMSFDITVPESKWEKPLGMLHPSEFAEEMSVTAPMPAAVAMPILAAPPVEAMRIELDEPV